MIGLGTTTELEIKEENKFGLRLINENGDSIMLPPNETPSAFQLGDKLKVFIYRNSSNEKVATLREPLILLHQFACLEALSVERVGAFMAWGLEKDLMVPFKEQQNRFEEGGSYVVRLAVDEETDRLFASNRVERHLQNETLTVEENEKVDILIYRETEIGLSVIVNNKHRGLIFKNEIFKDVYIGDRMDGYVKKIGDENKIDISLQKVGYKNVIEENAANILEALNKNNGELLITDKSSPDEIYTSFGISKKAFKNALGDLYKQRLITISKEKISLNN